MPVSFKLIMALALLASQATSAPVGFAPASVNFTPDPVQKSRPGLAYSPYNDDGTCKTRDQVFTDIASLKAFRLIRSYGTSCDQIRNIIDAAQPHGTKVLLGIHDIAQSDAQIHDIVRAVNGAWATIDTVSIGNEHVQRGHASARSLAAKVSGARHVLRAAGFSGPVVAIDTFDAVIRNPVLCEASDYAAVNIHPWFDWNTAARDAGVFLAAQVARVAAACPGRNVTVAETGWPHRGDAHGKAVASREEQEVAVRALYSVTGDRGVFLGPFDDLWKDDHGGTFGSEQFWGISNLDLFQSAV